jgi:hypothetical protein
VSPFLPHVYPSWWQVLGVQASAPEPVPDPELLALDEGDPPLDDEEVAS